ncbi:hypothetical protein J3R83DRAFT_5494 [Lanmaoa asiatica]|nr:hypothetical protein J3R83DRAFT_5494 [Lanmaoa asiatica]
MSPQTYFCGPGMAKALKEATLHHTSNNAEFTFAKVWSLFDNPAIRSLTVQFRNTFEAARGCTGYPLFS